MQAISFEFQYVGVFEVEWLLLWVGKNPWKTSGNPTTKWSLLLCNFSKVFMYLTTSCRNCAWRWTATPTASSIEGHVTSTSFTFPVFSLFGIYSTFFFTFMFTLFPNFFFTILIVFILLPVFFTFFFMFFFTYIPIFFTLLPIFFTRFFTFSFTLLPIFFTPHPIFFNPLTHITFFTSSISHFPPSKNKSLKPNALFLIVIIWCRNEIGFFNYYRDGFDWENFDECLPWLEPLLLV